MYICTQTSEIGQKQLESLEIGRKLRKLPKISRKIPHFKGLLGPIRSDYRSLGFIKNFI